MLAFSIMSAHNAITQGDRSQLPLAQQLLQPPFRPCMNLSGFSADKIPELNAKGSARFLETKIVIQQPVS